MSEPRPHKIGVWLHLPPAAICFPPENHIAIQLMCRLVKAELALDGIDGLACLVPPFNQLKGFVEVDDLARGISGVERVFSNLGLSSPLTSFAWYDFSELCWRTHPDGSIAAEFNAEFGPGVIKLQKEVKQQNAKLRKQIENFRAGR